jgi:hypothetical protein
VDKITTKRWAAFAGKARITSVLAETEEEAKTRVEEALNRPGRYAILNRWVECGKEVREVN